MSGSEETNPMAGFGEYLRREREMRGVSLQEISAATKISIRFLEAIENAELSKLPGGIFTRSFVRTYARYLGLDEERVLADCQLAGQQNSDIDIRQITRSWPRSSSPGSRTRMVAFLVAVALLASGYAVFRYERRIMEEQSSTPIVIPPSTSAPGAQAPSSAAPVQPSPAAQQENQQPLTPPSVSPAAGAAATAPGTPAGAPPSPNARANPSSQSAASEATSMATDTYLVLQVAATERAWVAVEADGETVLQKVLAPGEVENLKAHASFDVTTGNAQGVVLTLNGETLKPLGRRGEVKSIHLTRDDLKNAAPER